MYAVILAGGGGTRLRPLSRADRPKPFLPLIDERTLIRHTVDRLLPLPGLSGIFVVVSPAYAGLVRAQVPEAEVVVEPEGRNTAAAIALATLAIERPEDEVMAVLPSDHAIRREDVYRGVLAGAADVAGETGSLLTLGIRMDRAATDYGYLIPADAGSDRHGLHVQRLAAFREKPPRDEAERLYATGGGIAWNAGMFLWQRGVIRRALTLHTDLPLRDADTLLSAYPSLRTRSIDYEVMEPAAAAGRVLMASMDVGWTDIGGWSALLAGIGAAGQGRVAEPGETVELGPGDLLLRSGADGLALTAGPGTIAIDSPSALLIGAGADRDCVQALLDRVAAAEAAGT